MQYVYLIKSETLYKIGIANDPEGRLAQLQTGNPHVLELLSCYGFNNASVVEKSLHQAFSGANFRGEWFTLDNTLIQQFQSLCIGLGGQQYQITDNSVSDEEVEEAEEIQVSTEGAKFDYAAMFADGWGMFAGNNKKGDWCWRKRKANVPSEYIYGGLIKNLPYPIEEMRKVYGAK